MKAEITKNKSYFIYVLLGLFYFIAKIVYYVFGFVYLRGVMLGLIATILTIFIGILAFREYEKTSKPIAHWIAVLIPLIILPLNPVIMFYNLGFEFFQIEKISIFVILECLAIAQVIISVLMFRRLIIKSI